MKTTDGNRMSYKIEGTRMSWERQPRMTKKESDSIIDLQSCCPWSQSHCCQKWLDYQTNEFPFIAGDSSFNWLLNIGISKVQSKTIFSILSTLTPLVISSSLMALSTLYADIVIYNSIPDLYTHVSGFLFNNAFWWSGSHFHWTCPKQYSPLLSPFPQFPHLDNGTTNFIFQLFRSET